MKLPRLRALAEPQTGFSGLLVDLERLAHAGEAVTVSHLLETLGARGHGPIILTLASLMMLPTGLLPFMPTIIGILLALTAVEMIVGGKSVSVPSRLAKIEFKTARISGGIARARPLTRRLGRVLKPRLSLLVENTISLFLIAVTLLATALIMAVIGAVPGLPFVLCIPPLLFGLGLTAGDGIVILLGYLSIGLSLWLVFELLPQIGRLWPF